MTTPQLLLHIPGLAATLSDLPTDVDALCARLDGRTTSSAHGAGAADATERRWMVIRPVATPPARVTPNGGSESTSRDPGTAEGHTSLAGHVYLTRLACHPAV